MGRAPVRYAGATRVRIPNRGRWSVAARPSHTPKEKP